jgi:hypothetical protein
LISANEIKEKREKRRKMKEEAKEETKRRWTQVYRIFENISLDECPNVQSPGHFTCLVL